MAAVLAAGRRERRLDRLEDFRRQIEVVDDLGQDRQSSSSKACMVAGEIAGAASAGSAGPAPPGDGVRGGWRGVPAMAAQQRVGLAEQVVGALEFVVGVVFPASHSATLRSASKAFSS